MAARLRLLRRAAATVRPSVPAVPAAAPAEVSSRSIAAAGLLSGARRIEGQFFVSMPSSSGYNLRWYTGQEGYNFMARHPTRERLFPPSVRPCAGYSTKASKGSNQNLNKEKKDISAIEEDPYDEITYNIPQKPVTFTEGASYSLIVLAGLGVAALAGYGVFKELIFQPKEYKIFGLALKRIQNDNQVMSTIGSPVTGYGQESRNRAARQRISNKVWTDEDGVEHVAVNFYIRGPHGAGRVYAEMFKDSSDRSWKFMSLIVETTAPVKKQMLLESFIPS